MQDVQQTSLASQAFQEAMQANVDSPVSEPIVPASRVSKQHPMQNEPPPRRMQGRQRRGLAAGRRLRLILHETSSSPANLHRDSQGGWTGSIDNRWCLHSAADAVFDNIDAGRAELVQWARQHVAGGELLSNSRCIVLAADGQGRYRLWQVIRVEPSLRTQMEEALLGDAGKIASALLAVARSLHDDGRAHVGRNV